MNSPKIRFREYTDDWEQRKLVELVDVCSGRDYKHLDEGDIPVYGTGGYMLSVSEALSEDEDAIGIGRKGTIDKPFILKAPFWTVDTLFYCIPKNDYNLNFAFDIFQNINWKAMDESTGVPSLSKTAINNVDVIVPSADEQLKIGSYFESLDRLITLHQRKCEQTKTLKKYMLQKVFPQAGSNVPEIRFNGFTDDWEQRKLGDIAVVKDSARIPNSLWTDSGVPYIRASDISNDDLNGTLFLDKETYDFYRKQTGAPENGDVLFNGGGEIGKAVLKCDESHIYVQGGAVLYVKTSESIQLLGSFLKFYFETLSAKTYIDKVSAGGTMKHFTLKPAQEMPVCYPSKNEQKKIGDHFKSLDNLITLHQRKYEELQKLKKFMLQNMFV